MSQDRAWLEAMVAWDDGLSVQFLNDHGIRMTTKATGLASDETPLVITTTCFGCWREITRDVYPPMVKPSDEAIAQAARRSAVQARTHACGARN